MFGSWPLWARIGAPVGVAVLLLAMVGALAEPETTETTETSSSDTTEQTSTTTRRSTTTTAPTTTAPPTTTTTAPPTTTTAPPPPPTTAPPPPPTAPPPPPPTVAPPRPACHSAYSGCVPVASDVDCMGGSGDGPEYVAGPVQVYGSDPYGLDSDSDGVGCE